MKQDYSTQLNPHNFKRFDEYGHVPSHCIHYRPKQAATDSKLNVKTYERRGRAGKVSRDLIPNLTIEDYLVLIIALEETSTSYSVFWS
jgi:hypothetical protein